MARLTAFGPILIVVSGLVSGTLVEASASDAETALQFALARSLSAEGREEEALEAWRKLVLLAPSEPYGHIEFARFLSRSGNLDEALAEAAEARRLAPDNADILRDFARLHLAAGRNDPTRVDIAREALQRLTELQPENVEALFDLGRTYYEEGRWTEAAIWLERAVQQQPANRMMQSFRIDALLQSRQFLAARTVLEELLVNDETFLRGRLQLAALQGESGDHAAAARTLRAAPAEQLRDRELRWQLAGRLYRIGELEEGVELIDSLLDEAAGGFRENMMKALMLSALGHDLEAIALYDDLLEERPLNQDVVEELVAIHQRRGDMKTAEELLREASNRIGESGDERTMLRARFALIDHLWRAEAWSDLIRETRPLAEDPESPFYHQAVFLLVDALQGSGRTARALAVLDEAAGGAIASYRLQAKEAEILSEVGRDEEAEALLAELTASAKVSILTAAAEVYQQQERYEQAAQVLERAVEQEGEPNQVLYLLGAAYERSGDRTEAATVFQRLLARDPNFAPALNYLGYMWAEDGENLEQAAALVNRALALDPANGAYVDSLGWTYYRLGDLDRARRLLERAVRLIPDDAVVLEHLGDVYSQLGDANRARASYRRALELDGENGSEVRQKLDLLPTVQ